MAANRLIDEKSPYLLQHAHNPVDWYPWSEAAFEQARGQDKPIFLSIGYATCHWCHVMERESFENPAAARLLNETFVCIKVDREERPDIDAIYMAACHLLHGSGGWPLTVLLTADRQPFFAATYLPRTSGFGRAGLMEITSQVQKLWREQRKKVLDSAGQVASQLAGAFAFKPEKRLDATILDRAQAELSASFDAQHGGFGTAPKFPTPHRLRFLLRRYHRTGSPAILNMVARSLHAMRQGGIWDHVGFGFHRYATDRQWRVPHFEKMLYDQALMATAFLEAFQASGQSMFADTAEAIFSYVLTDMTDPEGGFYSAQDADSEGQEGKFYVWSAEEFTRVLGTEEAAFWQPIFNLRPEGNFAEEASGRKSGGNILHLDRDLPSWQTALGTNADALKSRWEAARQKLLAARKQRIAPFKDDKVLTDWNGLMIAALADGARILGNKAYAQAATQAARFVLERMRDQGRLLHRYREGDAAIAATANDYAFFVHGLLALYQARFDPAHLQTALSLQQMMIEDFWDAEAGGFYLTAATAEIFPARPKELYDGATPSANSVALENMVRLSRLTGNRHWDKYAQTMLKTFSGSVMEQPSAYTHFLMALDLALSTNAESVQTATTAEALADWLDKT